MDGQNDAQGEGGRLSIEVCSLFSGSVPPPQEGKLHQKQADSPESPPDFLKKLVEILERPENRGIIEWECGKIFIFSSEKLCKRILGKHFRHSKYPSFQRQLNYFGFKKRKGKGRNGSCVYQCRDLVGCSSPRSILSRRRRASTKPPRGASTPASKESTPQNASTPEGMSPANSQPLHFIWEDASKLMSCGAKWQNTPNHQTEVSRVILLHNKLSGAASTPKLGQPSFLKPMGHSRPSETMSEKAHHQGNKTTFFEKCKTTPHEALPLDDQLQGIWRDELADFSHEGTAYCQSAPREIHGGASSELPLEDAGNCSMEEDPAPASRTWQAAEGGPSRLRTDDSWLLPLQNHHTAKAGDPFDAKNVWQDRELLLALFSHDSCGH